ncbi:hypothetical protein SAMN06297387_102398 [Streptomyces zhaozhouensis]|uniref:Uncharacterized protein n=1 Tax=Streptomyces zhaozhouensis TaxID=1300267 RepID=A0A286DQM6_9ACTN|nr:hypothetical protein [Streptomyces zhaozhouensis]SOD60982.1 hypothetical protein SAMN06297387_102398 [Streptomyces zhaozhouensis]
MLVLTHDKLFGSAVADSAVLSEALPSVEVSLLVPVAPTSDTTGVFSDERPISAPETAAVAAAAGGVAAYGATANLAGAGHQIFGQQTKSHSMWALRGLDPWSDPT